MVIHQKLMLKLAILVLLSLGTFACAKISPNAQITPEFSQEQFPRRQATFGNTVVNYRVYVPKDRAVGERLPVLLYLHGADDRGRDNEKQLNGLAGLILANPDRFRMIGVFPQCEPDRFWDFDEINNARIALNDAIEEYDGDESRIYLSGHSLGAYGVWSMAARNSYDLAAIVPLSGRVLPRANEQGSLGDEFKELTDSANPYLAIAKRLGDLPVWVFHGADDKIVPIDGSRTMVQALRDAGSSNIRFSEIAGVGHNTIESAFQNPELFEWLARQQNKNISYENVPVTDDIVYGAVISAIAYDQNDTFGSIGGGMLLNLKGETISPENPHELYSFTGLPDDIRQDFLKNNKFGDKLSSSGYDAKVYIRTVEQSGSVTQIFKNNKTTEKDLYGVVGLSKVGFDGNHSRSLVYVEFYGAQNKLIRNYCLINWKRDGNGLMAAGRRWLF